MRRRILFLFIVCVACLHNMHGQVVGYLPEFQPRYKLIARFSGDIRDQNQEAVLVQKWPNAIERFDLESRTLSVLGTNSGVATYLIPNGYLLLSTNGLLQVEGAEETHLGEVHGSSLDFGTRVVEGRFGILRTAEGRVLRDFIARTNLLLSTNNGFTDVSANGSVAFTDFVGETNTAVRWYHEAKFETLAMLPRFPLPYVATDGTNVLWSEPSSVRPPLGSIFLRTATERIELCTNTFLAEGGWYLTEPRTTAVAMKGGWTIFPRWATNNPGTLNNLWRRSPEGEITQLTSAPAFILAMREDGGAIIGGGDGRIQSGIFYFPPNEDPKPLGGDYPLARYFASKNTFYARSPLQSGGSGLFEVEVEDDPFGLAYPRYNPETGRFTLTILPGTSGTYLLERTEDLIQWSTVETMFIDAIDPLDVEVATSPGMFRLRRQ